ncbi:MAG: DMT family transporter [Myxococcales bacterium]|nr:DMT family transporter [Myxococcales bacterium]
MGSSRDRVVGTALVLLAASSWGTWSLWLRPTGLPSEVTTPVLFLAMAIGAWPLALRERTPRWSKRTLLLLLAFGVSDAINVGTFFAAMNVTTVAIAVLTHYAAPVLVALLAPRIDGVHVPHAKLAALLALVGLTIVLQPWRELEGDVVLGATLGLASAFAYASNVFLARRLTEDLGASRTLGLHSVVAALLLLPLAGSRMLDIDAAAIPYLAIGCVGPGLLAGLAFFRALTLIGAARASILAFVEPLVACLVGWLAWDEPLGWSVVVGGALVIAAGVLVVAPRTPDR